MSSSYISFSRGIEGLTGVLSIAVSKFGVHWTALRIGGLTLSPSYLLSQGTALRRIGHSVGNSQQETPLRNFIPYCFLQGRRALIESSPIVFSKLGVHWTAPPCPSTPCTQLQYDKCAFIRSRSSRRRRPSTARWCRHSRASRRAGPTVPSRTAQSQRNPGRPAQSRVPPRTGRSDRRLAHRA